MEFSTKEKERDELPSFC